LPTILSQLLTGRTPVRLGRLDARRDLLFVADTVEGFTRAGAAAGVEGEVIQLGTGRMVSVGELFEIACRTLGVQATIEQEPQRFRPDASEVMALQADPSKAKALLGWEPQVTLEDGLRRTAEWLTRHRHLYTAQGYQV
jgi:UDP-glucose 4-epimerase